MSDTPLSVTIRPARPEDAAALARLFLDARRRAFSWIDPDTFHLDDFETQTHEESVWVAETAAGELAGFVSVWVPDEFVHHLYVSDEHRRRGVGRALLESLRSWLPLPHRLKCAIGNLHALAFYRRLGWKPVGEGIAEHGPYALLESGDPDAAPGRSIEPGQPLKLLFVCSRNRQRSLTAEHVFGAIPGLQVRSAGTQPDARIVVTAGHLGWADIIFLMEKSHLNRLRRKFPDALVGKRTVTLHIPDDFAFMHPDLVDDLKAKVTPHLDLDPW
jgi:predicted protein tyrosine phosphatase/GNAT superfamily N-acetyltransferase